MGEADGALPASAADRWNRSDTVAVTLLNSSMWLESRSELAVLAGANLALIGDELVQFTTAVAVSAGRFELGGWLRGRRGSAVSAHAAGERFVLIDPDRLVPFDPPVESIGILLRCKAVGSGEDAAVVAPVDIVIGANALRPLAPVHLAARFAADGDLGISWTRCSRSGFAWIDAAEAPVAEEREAYHLEIWLDGRSVRSADVAMPGWTYSSTAFAADGGTAAASMLVKVAQISAAVGPGRSATASFVLASLSID